MIFPAEPSPGHDESPIEVPVRRGHEIVPPDSLHIRRGGSVGVNSKRLDFERVHLFGEQPQAQPDRDGDEGRYLACLNAVPGKRYRLLHTEDRLELAVARTPKDSGSLPKTEGTKVMVGDVDTQLFGKFAARSGPYILARGEMPTDGHVKKPGRNILRGRTTLEEKGALPILSETRNDDPDVGSPVPQPAHVGLPARRPPDD